jgi:hypothetical protein
MSIQPILFLGVLGIAATLAGCATVTPVPLPNGQQGLAIEACDTMATCYKKAAEVCGGKYEIIGEGSKTSGASGYVGTTHSMTIQCKPGDETAGN